MTVPQFSFTKAPLSALSPGLRKELEEKIATKHHLEGAWTRDETGCPILAMSLDNWTNSALGNKILHLLRREGSPGFRVVGFASRHITPFGHLGTLTVAIAMDQDRQMILVARFCAPLQPVWVELCESPWPPEVILFRSKQPIQRLKASHLLDSESFPRPSSVMLEDGYAAYWDALSTDSNGWDLTPEDRLCIGWVKCLKQRCIRLTEWLKQFVTVEHEHLPSLSTMGATPALSKIWKELEWIRDNSDGRLLFEQYSSVLAEKRVLSRLFDAVDEVIKQYGLLRVFLDFDSIQAKYPLLSNDWFKPIWWATFVS